MSTRALKIILSCSFTGLAASLIWIRLTSARGYEVSIYEGTPLFAWIFLIGGIAVGISLIVRQAFRPKKDNWWGAGFGLIMLSGFIIVALPALRGYVAYNGSDHFAHIEFTNYLLADGRIWPGDIYPLTHILLAELSQISLVSPIVLAGYLPAFITVCGMLFAYLFAREIMSPGQALLVAAGGATFIFASAQVSLYPQVTALLLLPLVFYLYIRARERPSAALNMLLFIFLLTYPVLYPPVDLALILFLIIAEAARWLVAARHSGRAFAAIKEFSLAPIMIGFIAFIAWVGNSAIFVRDVGTLFNLVVNGILPRGPQVAVAESALQGLGAGRIVAYILTMYGDIIIAGILSLLAAVLIIRRSIPRDNVNWAPLGLVFIMAIAGPLHLMLLLTSPSVSAGRLLNANFAYWVMPLFTGYALFEIFRRLARVRQLVIATSILVVSAIVSIVGVYHSPLIQGPGWQVTYRAMASTGWFVNYNEPNDVTHVLGFDFFSAAGALGYHVAGVGSSGKYTLSRKPPQLDIPEHFGYLQKTGVGALFTGREYLIIDERFRRVAIDPRFRRGMIAPPNLARLGFTTEDFARLEADASANKVYSNGGTDIWQTYPVR